MAVVITLREVYEFRERYPGAKVSFGNPIATPVQHFNVLFRRLFGLAELPHDHSPHRIVDSIKTFLRCAVRSVLWYLHRCAKYTWAVRKRRMFLRQTIAVRRSRVAEALDRWEAHEADLDDEYETRLRWYRQRQTAQGKGDRGLRGIRLEALRKPEHTPKQRKLQVIAHVHRQRLHNTTADLRDWALHRQDLRKELGVLSRRLGDLWLWGSLRAFDDRSTTQLVVRVRGVRKRLLTYSLVPPHVQPLMWHTVTGDELKLMEEHLAPLNDAALKQVHC